MNTKPFSVLLLRPDYATSDYGNDTFLAHVQGVSRADAIQTARLMAYGLDGIGDSGEPEDYAVMLVLHGHHDDVPDETTDTKLRPLIVGAWYAVGEGEFAEGASAQLAEWTGEVFVDEAGTEFRSPDYAVLQQCNAAHAAGVTP